MCTLVNQIIQLINTTTHIIEQLKSSTFIDSSKEINDEDPKFKIGDIVRISVCKNTFAKDYVPNWSEEVFVITKVKILLRFMEKKLQKTNENEFSIEKVIKRKGDK